MPNGSSYRALPRLYPGWNLPPLEKHAYRAHTVTLHFIRPQSLPSWPPHALVFGPSAAMSLWNKTNTNLDIRAFPWPTFLGNEARRGQGSRYRPVPSTHSGRSPFMPAARQPHRGACPLCHGVGNQDGAGAERDRCRPPHCSHGQCRDRRHPVAPGVRSPGRQVCTRGSMRNRAGIGPPSGLPSIPRETGEAPAARRTVREEGMAGISRPDRLVGRRRPANPARSVRGRSSTGTRLPRPAGCGEDISRPPRPLSRPFRG
ncbi:hypothetical protein J3R73_003355 [Labrys monachus]|uniref:Uncharacterized protein n=1 Tax=Labrys monachus TaxID=217067 RepID=A0ABU0FG28_9HYPH|nr:hypothetical protein [Labrys monachus]